MSPLAEYPRTIVLKDGAHLLLRPATAADAAAVRALRDRLPAAAARRLGDVCPAAEGQVWLVAVDGGRIAGLLGLRRDGLAAADGGAELRLALDPDYEGRRLGTWMLLDAVHLAHELAMTRLGTTVPADAAAELAALRRLDFVAEEGSTPDGVRLVKLLHGGWTDF